MEENRMGMGCIFISSSDEHLEGWLREAAASMGYEPISQLKHLAAESGARTRPCFAILHDPSPEILSMVKELDTKVVIIFFGSQYPADAHHWRRQLREAIKVVNVPPSSQTAMEIALKAAKSME